MIRMPNAAMKTRDIEAMAPPGWGRHFTTSRPLRHTDPGFNLSEKCDASAPFPGESRPRRTILATRGDSTAARERNHQKCSVKSPILRCAARARPVHFRLVMRKRLLFGIWAASVLNALGAAASTPDGAIFTTRPDGSRALYNIFLFKPDVYLDGGPGDGAPSAVSGLPDGRYVFQVTDSSGKILLSIDQARCREFDVAGGFITGAAPAGGCEHATAVDRDHGTLGAKSLQICGGGVNPLAPTACFLDAPNPGDEYKVWVTLEADYLDGCALLGRSTGLNDVDCGTGNKGNTHGFLPRLSKTDNFKIGGTPREITTVFHAADRTTVDGLRVTWTDPVGASNNKYSFEDPALDVHHEAHVENVEIGTHQITLTNQPGCTIDEVYVGGKRQPKGGTQTVSIAIRPKWAGWSGAVFVDVYCRNPRSAPHRVVRRGFLDRLIRFASS